MAGYTVDIVSDANEVEPEMKEIGMSYYTPPNSKKINIHYIQELGNFYQYPSSNLRSERLFGLANELMMINKYDLIIGWYMIPYGKIAVDLSLIYNLKSLIIHGGSDLLTLSKHTNLKHTISYTLKFSTAILSANNEKIQDILIQLGADKNKIHKINKALPLPNYFDKRKKNISIEKITKIAQSEIQINYKNDLELENFFKISSKYKAFKFPIIVMYGKVGQGKQTIEILRILNEIKVRGIKFNFIGIFCGSRIELCQSLEYFINKTNLLSSSIILPPIAPWLVPGILEKANIGLCSEISFGVLNHLPILPREMIKFGVIPILSEDLYKSPFYEWIFEDKINALVAHNNDFEYTITELLENDINGEAEKRCFKYL